MKLILLLLLAARLQAAEWYVRDGGTCTSSCTDWTNASDQLTTANTNVARGDTIWVADGTYNSVTWNVAVSGTTLITIKKATKPQGPKYQPPLLAVAAKPQLPAPRPLAVALAPLPSSLPRPLSC